MEEDHWIFEFFLVVGFITTVAVISLCSAFYYICCHHTKTINRSRKDENLQQETPTAPVVVIVESDSCHQMEPPTISPNDDDMTETRDFSGVISMLTAYNIESAPPSYYVSANAEDQPPPYSLIEKPASITIEVFRKLYTTRLK